MLGTTVRHLGGALADPLAGNGGVAGPIDEAFIAFSIGIAGIGGPVSALRAALLDVRTALGDEATNSAPYNFLGGNGVDYAYDAGTLDRLRALKRDRDPGSRLRMTRSLLA